jgi:hypothetical protein
LPVRQRQEAAAQAQAADQPLGEVVVLAADGKARADAKRDRPTKLPASLADLASVGA